jgi:hypothetical protein
VHLRIHLAGALALLLGPGGCSAGGVPRDAGVDAAAHDSAGSDAAHDDDGGSDSGAAGVCDPNAPVCVPPAGTPVYQTPASVSGTGELFHQPMIGGQAWLGAYTDVYDGYSVVITWPGQAAALAHTSNTIAAWGGVTLDDDVFIQNGYFADTTPCHGADVVQVYQNGATSQLLYGVSSVLGAVCAPGQKMQFRAERDGTTWVFSMRAVGGGDFVEEGRYDVGAVAHAVFPAWAYLEMYDYAELVTALEPVTFGPFLLKTLDGQWKPVDRMTSQNSAMGSSPRLPIRPEPALAGVTVGAPGPVCNGYNVVLWSSDSPTAPASLPLPCWATDVRCDATTSACAP